MKGEAHKVRAKCWVCGGKFRSKPMGYNARYCSRRCKTKAQRKRTPETFKRSRKRSYEKIKLNDKRYAGHLKSCRKSKRGVRAWLAEYKLKRGCVDCGYKGHPAALQFDHEGKKIASISELRSSPRRILREIKAGKCKIRCSICHAVKTWADKNKLRYVPGMAQTDHAWFKHLVRL